MSVLSLLCSIGGARHSLLPTSVADRFWALKVTEYRTVSKRMSRVYMLRTNNKIFKDQKQLSTKKTSSEQLTTPSSKRTNELN